MCLEEKGTFITLRRHKTYTTNKHPCMIAGAKRRKIRKTAARRNEATAYHHRCSRSLRVVNDIYIDKGKKMNNNNNKITNNKQTNNNKKLETTFFLVGGNQNKLPRIGEVIDFM